MLGLPSLPIVILFVATLARAAAPIDSIARIRALSPEEAARQLPAAIEALIIFRDPAAHSLIAWDGRGGIYVELPSKAIPDLVTGTRLRIEGVTHEGGFLPILESRSITVLGAEPLPAPRRIDAGELFSPSLDCQWVEVSAIITGVEAGSGVVLVAEVSGWTVKLLLPATHDSGEHIARLMQRPVIVRGAVGSVFNAHRQLTGRHFFVPSFDQIVPSETDAPAGEPRLREIDELLRSDATARSRVRVRGVVTHSVPDGLYLRGAGGSIFVRAATAPGLEPGTRVEAEGFGAVAPFRPILRATSVTTLDRVPSPQALPLDLSGKKLVGQQAELVTLEADLLGLREGLAGEALLQCRAGKWFFEAPLPAPGPVLQRLRDGDRLRLTGICELITKEVLPFGKSADGFRLHLRSASDLAILRSAPWWTLRRLLWALAGVGALALASLAWVALLRRRVTEQTGIIGAQIERAAIKDERQRIARELHDTIEQELAGVSIQLRNARQRIAHAPAQAGTSLELAEKMLRHCRDEARTSIRDLRSIALEQSGLRGALEEFLAPQAAACGAKFTLAVEGMPRSLPGPVEIHLLRIAHEAAANAARHAAPRAIRVRLEYGGDAVALEIRDDGCGFDAAAPAPRGHFGILGLQERANKLHAALTIESEPGAGTTIRVVVPAGVVFRENGHPA